MARVHVGWISEGTLTRSTRYQPASVDLEISAFADSMLADRRAYRRKINDDETPPMITISNKGDADRNLPAADYGHFDIRHTEDGKEFSTPHTIGATALSIMSERRALVAVTAAAIALTFINPIKEANSPLNRYWLYLVLTFLLVHLICTFAVLVFAAATGIRKVTRLTIREDGLVWNRTHFFPVEHIWGVGYGTTIDEGKASEVYEPLITIDLGVNKIVLAEGLDVPSAALFKRVFSDDVRRYWHRHN